LWRGDDARERARWQNRRVAPVVPDPANIRSFDSAEAFEAWLAQHHAAQRELWLKLHKKDSGLPTVTYAEAVDVALCWGWIDGLRKAFDARSFLQRFTPRKAKSIWSQVNREHVARLAATGRMTPHGLRHVEAAKADGRWDAAYAPARSMTLPDDLRAAIDADAKASATLAKLDKANVYALAFRVQALKTPTGRAKRMAEYVAMLARGETIHPMSSKPAAVGSAAKKAKQPTKAKQPPKAKKATKKP
jgi:uncharacterized protein YdeI (YjbR/CyaY-like superfamily)